MRAQIISARPPRYTFWHMLLDVAAEVMANTQLSPDYNVIALSAPEVARVAQPGQFVMIRTQPGLDPLLRRPFSIFERLRAEWQASIDAVRAIMRQQELLEGNKLLARSIRNRFPYIDPLNHVQIELLRRHRAGDSDEDVVQGIRLSINGIAAGLRNSG